MPTHAARAIVDGNEPLSPTIYRLRIHEPAMAREIVPGQFVMVRPAHGTDPLLGRPLALYDIVRDAAGEPAGIDLVYLVQGNGTRALARLQPGDEVQIWGPLGNFFPRGSDVDATNLLLLAGGIGQTPFLAVARERLGGERYGAASSDIARSKSVTLVWGGRSKSAFAGVEDFERAGVRVELATEDGSIGFHGRVTDYARQLMKEGLKPTAILSCGPEPMLAAVARLGEETNVPTWVSLETKMACGYGVCFSCVCPVRDAEQAVGWDYRRVCLEGPVFPSTSIAWAEMT